MDDLISRQAAIDALRKMQTYKLFSGDDMLLIDQAGAQTELMMLPPAQPDVPDINVGDMISRQAAIDMITNHWSDFSNKKNYKVALACVDAVPPALPEPMKIDLSRYSKEDWERIKKEWANTPITTIAAQPYTIIDGRLFITVDDIEQVDCVLVAEYKSKFCREFWMSDADEPAQPERKRGKWIYQLGRIKCDQCLRAIRRIDHDGLLNFCPNCGADMREVTE